MNTGSESRSPMTGTEPRPPPNLSCTCPRPCQVGAKVIRFPLYPQHSLLTQVCPVRSLSSLTSGAHVCTEKTPATAAANGCVGRSACSLPCPAPRNDPFLFFSHHEGRLFSERTWGHLELHWCQHIAIVLPGALFNTQPPPLAPTHPDSPVPPVHFPDSAGQPWAVTHTLGCPPC